MMLKRNDCSLLEDRREILQGKVGCCLCAYWRLFSSASLLCFLLQIAPVENDTSYDELKRDAKLCLSLMSQGLLYPHQVPLVLQVLKQVRVRAKYIRLLVGVSKNFTKSAAVHTVPDNLFSF